MTSASTSPASAPAPADPIVDLTLPVPNIAGVPLFLLPRPLSRADEAIVTELHRRGRASRHLDDYARYCLDVEPALHHRVICEALTDMLLHDACDVIVINTPPGAAKSTYTSHALCAFALGSHPRCNVILATHTADLSERWSRKVRDTIAGEEHQRVFPASSLSKNSTAVGRWATSAGGEFLAAGVGGSILGFRADLCLTGSTRLRTKTGYTPISDIEAGEYILGFDTEKFSTGYYRVVAKKRRDTDIIYRIHTTDGRVVEATGNHPFFTPRGFAQADTLVVGDILLSSLRFTSDHQSVGPNETAGTVEVGTSVLLEKLFKSATEACCKSVRRVRRFVSSCKENVGILFKKVLGKTPLKKHQGDSLFALQPAFSGNVQGREILFDGVQERQPLGTDGICQEPELEGRKDTEQVSGGERATVPRSEEVCEVSGQQRLRGVQGNEEPSRTSCGWGRDEQLSFQCRDDVRSLSHDTTWGRTGETSPVLVAGIEVVCGNADVWDIQVDDVHNFFAEGILTHNCVIDDPINGFEMAQSETQLEKVHAWYETDLVTRLKPGAKQVIICQRLSPNDLAGYLIQRNRNNPSVRQRVMIFRMEAEPGDADDGTGRKPGDRLWPEWFSPEMVEDARRDDYKWRTLYQQKPPSDSGSWVSADEIVILDPDAPQDTMEPDDLTDLADALRPADAGSVPRYLCSDLALSVNKGDFTVHLTCAVTTRGAVVVTDAWRGRVSVDVSVERHLDLCEVLQAQGVTLMESLIDDDNASKVYVQLLASRARQRGVPVPYKPLPLRGQDKETRAAPLRGLFKRRMVKLVKAPWNSWLKDELLAFPNAMGEGVDDGVDALSLMGRRLVSLARPSVAPAENPPVKTIQQATLNELWEDREMGRRSYGRGRV